MNRRTPLSALPRWLQTRLHNLRLVTAVDWSRRYDDKGNLVPSNGRSTATLAGAEAVTSQWRRTGDTYDHMILVDLDVEAALVPSSTPGHHHLYIDAEVRWEDYLAMLRAMQKCGVVEKGYVDATEARGEAYLRLPWIRKYSEETDAMEALENWLEEGA